MSRAARQTPPFFYLAATASGKRSVGLRTARSERALADTLRRERLILLRSIRLPGWLASETKLKLKDHAEINEQLAQLVGRGVPLVEALEVTERTVRAQAQSRVGRIKDLVAAGSSFADACQQVGSFDTVNIAVYRASERTGDLAGACAQLSKTIRRQLAVSGKAGTMMIYPVMVLTIGVLISLGMLMFIIPMIGGALTSLAEQSGNDLPGFTLLMMTVGLTLREHLLIFLLSLGGLVVLALALRRRIAAASGWLARRLPLLKDVVLAQESARFFSVMAAMTRAGVPLADALSVSVKAVQHEKLRAQLTRMRNKLVEGGVLVRLIDQVTALPLATRKLLIAADRSGDLEHAFDDLAEDLQADVETKSDRFLAALQPLLLVALFAMIGALVLSIMLPMIQATGQVF